MSTTQKVQLAIRATPEQVWTALTDGAITPAYYQASRPNTTSPPVVRTGTPPTAGT